ncbi:MAG TPA: GntR family transcriptional regulator [Gemmatimonas sp.]|nr:GntR family transcriptional regulator [Gemmatimonas sp.]
MTALQPAAPVASLPAGRPRPADVYDQLQQLIVRGRLLPGVRLTEIGVAERLGVSRTPAREALHRLQQDGLLVPTSAAAASSSRTRLVVAPLQRDEMVELYHIAAALEGVAVRVLSRQPADARRSLVTELQERNDRFATEARRPLAERNLDDLFERHQAFHALLIERGAGTQLQRQLAVIRPLVDRYEWFYAPLAGSNLEVSIDEHAAVVQAVRAGGPDASEAALRANWWNGAERLAQAIDRVGDRGTW